MSTAPFVLFHSAQFSIFPPTRTQTSKNVPQPPPAPLTRSACISPHVPSFTKFYTAMFLTRKLAKEMLPIILEKKMRMIFPFNIPSNLFYSCAGLLLLWAENFYTTWRLRGTLNFLFVIRIKRIFTTKTEKFHLHGNNSMCAGAFQLLRGRAA